MKIDLKKLSESLARSLIGHVIIFLEQTDSTNSHAAVLARQGAAEGTVILADSQTAGKGRLGRIWQSPGGKNLYASIILRPHIELPELSQITLAAGIAVAETVLGYCQGVALKWPNDVQINGKKVCGILAEMQSCGDRLDFVIVGIGVNINIRQREFQEEFRNQATSIFEETGIEADRNEFLIALLNKFEHWYRIFLSGDFQKIRSRWLGLAAWIGKQVQVVFNDRIEKGKLIGLDDNGALLLIDDQNRIQAIMAGDVSLRETKQ